MLKLIQLGLTFADADGRMPHEYCTWQFNFKFNLATDMYASDSIELLQKSGIDFQRLSVHGIDPSRFAELLHTSGLVLNREVRWISFHSSYDFAYLVKVLSGYGSGDGNGYRNQKVQRMGLSRQETDFFQMLHVWFPRFYDIKYLTR